MKRFPIALICILPILSLLAGCGGFNNVPPGDVSPQAQGAVRAAYSQMGKPYRIGGASPRQGFDCSGLIYWAYGKNGVKVPRITKDQLRAGHGVSKDAPLPGDILVFRIGRRTLHTGLYAGGNAFIHAPRKGSKVRMESLSSPYWSDKLISIRRISG